jgi:hypothetical protein
MQRQDRCQVTGLRAEALFQAYPNQRMPAGLASRWDTLIQDVLIESMAKAKTRGDRAIRPFSAATRLEELLVVRQRRALGLYLSVGALEARRDRCGRKLDASHTSGFEQRLRLGTAVRQLVLNQRPECHWDDRGAGAARCPPSTTGSPGDTGARIGAMKR